jgi:hypothetical protein
VLLNGRGLDMTALFESYHPFTERPRARLASFKPVSPTLKFYPNSAQRSERAEGLHSDRQLRPVMVPCMAAC